MGKYFRMRGINTHLLNHGATQDHVPAPAGSAEDQSRRRSKLQRLGRVPGILTIALALVFGFTALYATGFHDPRPHGVKIGLVGPGLSAAQASSAINRTLPGGFTFERYAVEPDALTRLRNADIQGLFVLGSRSDSLLVTGAFGFAPTEAVTDAARSAAAASGHSLTVHDVNSLPPWDSRGLASFFTVFGTLVPSIVFGALLTLLGKQLPARVRWPAVILFALGAGVLAAVGADTVVGALRGHFWAVAGVATLLAFAVASIVHGLGRLAGTAGVAATALVLMMLGQSSSGGALTFELEPSFYGAVSQLLPNGAAISAMRNSVYFHGAHTLVPLLVLSIWGLVGVALGLTGEAIQTTAQRRQAAQPRAEPVGPTAAAA